MKVLFIHSQCENGGISRIVFSLCDMLMQKDMKAKYAFSRGFVPEGRENICYMFGNRKEIAWHMLMTRVFDAHGLYSKKATRELIEYIIKFKPDIIHMNNVHGYYLNIKVFFEFIRKYNIPIVWTFHDCWAITGHCSHFEYYGCEQWKSGCERCKHKKVYPKSWLMNCAKRNYLKKKNLFNGVKRMHLVVPSKWLKDIVEDSMLSKYPCTVINNGINLDVFCEKDIIPEKAKAYVGKDIILAVASVWTERKGYRWQCILHRWGSPPLR